MVPNAPPVRLTPRQASQIEGACHLGAGTGRTVFGFSSNKTVALKVARNEMGRAQNEVEFRTADPEFTARVFAHSPHWDWLLVERADRCRSEDLKPFGVTSGRALYRHVLELAHHNGARRPPTVPALVGRLSRFLDRWPALMPYDMGQLSSWGLRDDRPILIDWGFTFRMNWFRSAFANGHGGDPLARNQAEEPISADVPRALAAAG